ncbi:MAG TPA: hypothetical protein VHO90_06995 [Bacteroidales bacterium]|nr:hypothetical protein [Bacteroidales bacterium]
MKQEEKYKELIGKLRNKRPSLPNPKLITDSVMEQIVVRRKLRTVEIIELARPWLAIAAVVLAGVFIYQQEEAPYQESKPVINTSVTKGSISKCFADLLIEKAEGRSLIQSYQCYLKESELKKKREERILSRFIQ